MARAPIVQSAFDQGGAEASRDIDSGNLRYFYQAPMNSAWGEDLKQTLRSHFEIELVFAADLVTNESISFEEGYNEAIRAFVDRRFGTNALQGQLDEVQKRRQVRYAAWRRAAENPQSAQ